MCRAKLLLLLLALGPWTPGWAQVAADIGQRVRVTYGAKQYAIGTLESVSSESVTIYASSKRMQLAIPRTTVTAVERSLGKHRNFWPKFLTTFGVSSLAFGFISAMSYEPCEPKTWFDCLAEPASSGEAFGWGLAGGAVLGLPLGLIVGSATTERWEPITVSTGSPSAFSWAPLAGPGGIGIRGRLHFR